MQRFDKALYLKSWLGWSVQEVNQNFLERVGLGYMAEQFTVNKISGKCLLLMTEVSQWSFHRRASFL